jgi:tol-pal system protein YbgF
MVLDPEAKRAYDAALSLVNARQYGPALAALAAFLVKWPDHPYVDHAMYWRGECYFAQGDYTAALEQFDGVIARFPAGSKAPDALLKLGICHQKLGRAAQAKASFDRLLQEYPQSDAARRAPHSASPAPEDPR